MKDATWVKRVILIKISQLQKQFWVYFYQQKLHKIVPQNLDTSQTARYLSGKFCALLIALKCSDINQKCLPCSDLLPAFTDYFKLSKSSSTNQYEKKICTDDRVWCKKFFTLYELSATEIQNLGVKLTTLN